MRRADVVIQAIQLLCGAIQAAGQGRRSAARLARMIRAIWKEALLAGAVVETPGIWLRVVWREPTKVRRRSGFLRHSGAQAIRFFRTLRRRRVAGRSSLAFLPDGDTEYRRSPPKSLSRLCESGDE